VRAEHCGARLHRAATRCKLPTSSILNLRVHSPRTGYIFFFRPRPSPNLKHVVGRMPCHVAHPRDAACLLFHALHLQSGILAPAILEREEGAQKRFIHERTLQVDARASALRAGSGSKCFKFWPREGRCLVSGRHIPLLAHGLAYRVSCVLL
jgi:hypothetical protein